MGILKERSVVDQILTSFFQIGHFQASHLKILSLIDFFSPREMLSLVHVVTLFTLTWLIEMGRGRREYRTYHGNAPKRTYSSVSPQSVPTKHADYHENIEEGRFATVS